MDLERAEDQLNSLIEKRAKGREAANAEFAAWHEPTRQRRQQIRRENARAWVAHYESMARTHHGLAAEAAAKADAALEELERLVEHANERSKR